MKHVIITKAEVDADFIQFDKVAEDSKDTLRWCSSNLQTFVSYDGNKPYFLYGKTAYDTEDFLTKLDDPNGPWYIPSDI